MKTTPMKTLLLASLFLASCSYHTNVRVTKSLTPGMNMSQVRTVMGGDPASTAFVGDKIIWHYTLARPFVGNTPYVLVFDKETQQIEGWAANEEEFRRNQQALFQTWGMLNRTLPPTQRRKVEVKIKRR